MKPVLSWSFILLFITVIIGWLFILGAICINDNPIKGRRVYLKGEYTDIAPEDYTLEYSRDDMQTLVWNVVASVIVMFILGGIVDALITSTVYEYNEPS